jgi:hypothetical protein
MSILNLPNIQSVRLIGADLCWEKSTNLPDIHSVRLSGWLLISDNRFDCDSNLLAWFTASANLPQQNYSGRWQHEKEGTTGETSSTKFTSNKWNTSARPAGARLLHMKPVNVSGWNIFNIDPTSQHNHQLSRPTYLGWTLVINHQSSQ